MRKRFDYLQLRLDILSQLINGVFTPLHESQFGLSVKQLRVLRFVKSRPGLVQGELIGLTTLEKSTISRVVDSLATAGLLTRRAGENDARQVKLFLTSSGAALLRSADPFSKYWQKRFLAVLADDELATLHSLLDRLIEHSRKTIEAPGAVLAVGHRKPSSAKRTQR